MPSCAPVSISCRMKKLFVSVSDLKTALFWLCWPALQESLGVSSTGRVAPNNLRDKRADFTYIWCYSPWLHAGGMEYQCGHRFAPLQHMINLHTLLWDNLWAYINMCIWSQDVNLHRHATVYFALCNCSLEATALILKWKQSNEILQNLL